MSHNENAVNVEDLGAEEVTSAQLEALKQQILAEGKVTYLRDNDPISDMPERYGGVTVLFLVNAEAGKVLVTAGVARCNSSDLFNKKLGRTTAIDKLIYDPLVLRLDLSARALLDVTRDGLSWKELPKGSFLQNHVAETIYDNWMQREANRRAEIEHARYEAQTNGSEYLDSSDVSDAASSVIL